MHNISYYLNTTVAYDDYIDNLYAAIKEYFQKVKNLKLQNKLLNSISYKNKKHILMALIVYLNENEENINKRKIFRRFDYEKFKPFIDSTRQIITPLYKTLKLAPLYSISTKIGCFPLERKKYKNIKDEIRHHWEYHSFETPLWRERLKNTVVLLIKIKNKLILLMMKKEKNFMKSIIMNLMNNH